MSSIVTVGMLQDHCRKQHFYNKQVHHYLFTLLSKQIALDY